MRTKDGLKDIEDITILGILFSGNAFLSIFMVILHYNPDPILILCVFSLMLWWIYLIISYQREIEENMKKKEELNVRNYLIYIKKEEI